MGKSTRPVFIKRCVDNGIATNGKVTRNDLGTDDLCHIWPKLSLKEAT